VIKLTTKDTVGLVMVAGTFAALLVHNSPLPHRASHVRPVADAGGAVTSAAEVPTIAFYDVNVVPMDRERVLRHQVVLVQNGFVRRIDDVGVVDVPAGARRIEGRGTMFLAPGLTDAHVHLGDEADELLPLYLANGVTTVFNLEGSEQHLRLRDRVLAGEVPGPTIYTAGPFVNEGLVRSPAEAAAVVGQQKRRGFDFVKLHGDLPEETYGALTRAGMENGISIVGHAPRNLPFSAVLESHQAGVSHAEELIYTEFMSLDPAALRPVAERMAAAGTWLTPAIANFGNTVRQWGSPEGTQAALSHPGADFLPPTLRTEWAASRTLADQDSHGRLRLQQMLAFHEPLVRTFHDAGVPLLAGTDAGLPGMVPGFSLADEIAALRHAGLSGYEALEAATSNAGRFVRERVDPDADFGTIHVNARADLVLLEADPRTSADALRQPAGVMVRGAWFDRTQLDQMLRSVTTSR